jgi:DNA-binding NarL/FixJ family response regulator
LATVAAYDTIAAECVRGLSTERGAPVRILIVDDHALVREGLATLLRSLSPGASVAHAGTFSEAMSLAASGPFTLALVDLQLPDQPGFGFIERLRAEYPEIPVVVVSAHEDRDSVIRALDLGAKAFIPKSADVDRVREGLAAVLDGRVFLPDAVRSASGGAPAGETGDGQDWNLTDRQTEVLALLVAGLPNKLIARRLEIAESTVKIHVSAILRELRVASRTQALIAVARAGIRLPHP